MEDTLEGLEKIIKSNQRVTLVGDFNCSEVNWKTFVSKLKIHGEIDY